MNVSMGMGGREWEQDQLEWNPALLAATAVERRDGAAAADEPDGAVAAGDDSTLLKCQVRHPALASASRRPSVSAKPFADSFSFDSSPQVDGCLEELSGGPRYFIRHRICSKRPPLAARRRRHSACRSASPLPSPSG